MKKHSIWMSIAFSALLAGCAAPKDGREDATYYYSNRDAKRVAAVQAAPTPVPMKNGPAGVSRIVYFDFDKSAIRPQDRSIVDAHASFLRSRPDAQVMLEGHTDERGGRQYNVALGQRRAESVRQALELLGVQTRRLEPTSWGMEKPASPEHTEEGWQLNRRVEFSYR